MPNPRSVRLFYEELKQARTKQRSKKDPETALERGKRLWLEDAREAISMLADARLLAEDQDKVREINKQIAGIAQQALAGVQRAEAK